MASQPDSLLNIASQPGGDHLLSSQAFTIPSQIPPLESSLLGSPPDVGEASALLGASALGADGLHVGASTGIADPLAAVAASTAPAAALTAAALQMQQLHQLNQLNALNNLLTNPLLNGFGGLTPAPLNLAAGASSGGAISGGGSGSGRGKGDKGDRSAPHPSLQKPEHQNSRATRRGPMDEMRQLVRILTKILPDSMKFMQASAEDGGGGGNRVSEQQIKAYLKATLGEEAPQPEWGMPAGWGHYLASLFTWALDRPISDEQARRCAKRQQGRSWEVVESELGALGIYAYAWPLPLTKAGVRAAQHNPGPPRGNFVGPPAGGARPATSYPQLLSPIPLTSPSPPPAASAASGPVAGLLGKRPASSLDWVTEGAEAKRQLTQEEKEALDNLELSQNLGFMPQEVCCFEEAHACALMETLFKLFKGWPMATKGPHDMCGDPKKRMREVVFLEVAIGILGKRCEKEFGRLPTPLDDDAQPLWGTILMALSNKLQRYKAIAEQALPPHPTGNPGIEALGAMSASHSLPDSLVTTGGATLAGSTHGGSTRLPSLLATGSRGPDIPIPGLEDIIRHSQQDAADQATAAAAAAAAAASGGFLPTGGLSPVLTGSGVLRPPASTGILRPQPTHATTQQPVTWKTEPCSNGAPVGVVSQPAVTAAGGAFGGPGPSSTTAAGGTAGTTGQGGGGAGTSTPTALGGQGASAFAPVPASTATSTGGSSGLTGGGVGAGAGATTTGGLTRSNSRAGLDTASQPSVPGQTSGSGGPREISAQRRAVLSMFNI